MKRMLFSLLLLSLTVSPLFSQDQTGNSLDLLKDLSGPETQTPKLLPDHFLLTQRMMWGEKGLMRNFDRFELTPEKRQNELKLRRTMLTVHQYLGFATLAGMTAQGIVGQKLYNGQTSLRGTHESLAAAVNVAYFSTAGLSLFAPPKMTEENAGFSSIKLHKTLAIIHFTSMIATNVLAGMLESDSSIRPYHRAAALTAYGTLAASLIVIKF